MPLLEYASQFSFGARFSPIQVDRMYQLDGSTLWAVRHNGSVWAGEGFQQERLGSQRDAEYMEKARFTSLAVAIATAQWLVSLGCDKAGAYPWFSYVGDTLKFNENWFEKNKPPLTAEI